MGTPQICSCGGPCVALFILRKHIDKHLLTNLLDGRGGWGMPNYAQFVTGVPPPALYAPLKLTHSSRGRYKSRPCRRKFPRGYKSILQNFGNPYRSLKIQLTRIFFFLPHDLSFKILPKSNACVKKELIVLHKI